MTRADGTLPHPQTLSYYFDKAVAAAGLPKIGLHDCRHTFATLLLEAGVHPKVVQEMLGHSSIAITLNIYSHDVPGMADAASEALDAAVFGR